LPVQDESQILLADTPETFAAAIRRVLEDEEFAFHLGRRSAKLVREQFGWNRVARRFAEICEHTRLAASPMGDKTLRLPLNNQPSSDSAEQEIELLQTLSE